MHDNMPKHIVLIMDGNRRWAKRKGLSIFNGHDAGAKNIEPLIKFASDSGITFLTFWAFSSENWKRGKLEVELLLRVFRGLLKSDIVTRMIQEGVKIHVIGDYEAFPKDIVVDIKKLIAESKNNKKITVTFALNYGGRQEILRAANRILKEKVSPDGGISEEIFSSYLDTVGQPDPDLIIRTGGQQRLSGFLPWQSVYSELYFTETYWPDFGVKEFEEALAVYAKRERRFGK